MRSSIRSLFFPLMVLAALCVAGYLTASVHVPTPVPDYALQAAAIYRLEVGAACFALLYLATMSFLLALDGRGFAEVGNRGLKVEQVVRRDDDQDENLADQMKLVRSMDKDLQAVEAAVEATAARLRRLDRKVRQRDEEE